MYSSLWKENWVILRWSSKSVVTRRWPPATSPNLTGKSPNSAAGLLRLHRTHLLGQASSLLQLRIELNCKITENCCPIAQRGKRQNWLTCSRNVSTNNDSSFSEPPLNEQTFFYTIAHVTTRKSRIWGDFLSRLRKSGRIRNCLAAIFFSYFLSLSVFLTITAW